MRINTNTIALSTANILSQRDVAQGTSLEKLSSGYRINRAADDAAGLVISQKLRAQISGLKVATRNAQDGISMMQVAEGAYASAEDHLQRMSDLLIQYASIDASDTVGKAAVANEWSLLRVDAGVIFQNTTWGDDHFLAGLFDRTFQVGPGAGDVIHATILDGVAGEALAHGAGILTPETLAIDDTVDYSQYGGTGTVDMATAVKNAIDAVSAGRAFFGSIQNRLESTLASLQNATENLMASESRIRDTDMAQEMVTFTKHQILAQAGTAMLAQANQLPAVALRLLN